MPKHPAGFVLVAVLLIVALATVLVVVASMMAQIERRAASNVAKVDLARSHALFALDAALNQLQTAAGPDQRITARAEILDGTPADAASIAEVTQPYWTGVWKTGAANPDVASGGTPQRQATFGSASPTKEQIAAQATWLVSGANANPRTFSGTTQGGGRDAVVLAAEYGPNPSDVSVPLVPVQVGGSTTGAYAYWVSDEGVKARVNETDHTLGVLPDSDLSKSVSHFIGPQSSAAHKGLSVFGGTDIRTNPDLPKVTTIAGLANLPGLSGLSGKNANRYAADITTTSRSVLADVRRGGLKVDLTASLEDAAAFTSLIGDYGYGAGMLYRSETSAGLTVPGIDTSITPPTDGLLWHNLFFHYNAYKGSQPTPVPVSGGAIAPTGSGNPASQPQSQSFRAYSVAAGGTNSTKLGALLPVAIAYRVDVALSSYQVNGQWRLRLHYYPQLVLWNPYSVRLTLPQNYQFQRTVGAFSGAGSYNATSPSLTSIRILSTSGGTTTTGPYFRVNQTVVSSGRLTLQTALGDCATLEPGETRVFALDADATFSSPQQAIAFTNLVSNPGMSPDFSQQADVTVSADSLGISTGTAFTTSDPTTRINVQLAAPRLRCQNVDTFVLPRELKWPATDGSTRIMGSGGWDILAATSAWDPQIQIQQLNGSPRRIIGFYVRQKGLLPSAGTNVYSNGGSGNTVPVFMGNAAPLSPTEDVFSYAWQEVYLSPLGTLYQNGQTDVQIAPSGDQWETSFGSESAGAGPPGIRCVVRDVPNQPLLSLGQFMQMPAMNFRSIGSYEVLGMGGMFVGGSYASPIIPTNQNAMSIALGTIAGGGANNKLFLDDSYLANEALFDRFFLSTVPPQNLNAPGTVYPSAWTAFNAANSGSRLSDPSTPLLNARMKPYLNGGNAPLMAELRDARKAAANLLLEGGFNVNSSSVAAWKAFLGGLSGNDLRIWDATAKTSVQISTTSGTPFSRFWSGSGRTAPNQLWSGLRVLSDSQLDELASAIVQQVKTRGPFLSVADFLNRRLGPAGELTISGALQSAIDNTTINSSIKASGLVVKATAPAESGKVPNLIAANMKDGAGNPWNTVVGVPGYLMQQDIVQAIAPSITARSDTFLVRTYGEVRNPRSGEVEGQAWAEAVVQRFPEWVDESQNPEADIKNSNPVNVALGRRFKVVSFRWLNENEI